MRWVIRMVLLAAAFAVATVAGGWWGVAVVALCWGVIARARRASALESALAALLAWCALLGIAALRGPVDAVALVISGALRVRPVGVYVVTMAFPTLLALTAALVARSAALLRGAH